MKPRFIVVVTQYPKNAIRKSKVQKMFHNLHFKKENEQKIKLHIKKIRLSTKKS